MKIKIGGYVLFVLGLLVAEWFYSSAAQAKGPFDSFKGNGRASGSITLVNEKPARTSCARTASPFGDGTNLAFTLSCGGATSFTLSCRLKARGDRLSGSCQASTGMGSASLSGGGTIRGSRMHLSMRSNYGTHAYLTISGKSISMRSPDARYVRALSIRAS